MAQAWPDRQVTQQSCDTGTLSNVASSGTSATILASNASRRGAVIFNTDTANLYLDFSAGTATTTTGFTVRIAQNAYYEVPFGFTGAITGIWDGTPGTGHAVVTEFTGT